MTTQMICRYYWNLGVENRQRSDEASQTENTQRGTLADKNNRSTHFFFCFLLYTLINTSSLLEKDEARKKQFGYSCGRVHSEVTLSDTLWTAGDGKRRIEGKGEMRGAKGKLSVRWLPHANLSPPCC